MLLQSFVALSALAAAVAANGSIVAPGIREPGDGFKASCGQTAFDLLKADPNLPQQNLMTAGPGDPTHAPGNSTHIPGHSTHRPGNSTYPPGNSTYPPEHPTYPPGNSTHPPGHPTYPPGNSTHPPWNSTHTPGNPPHKQESCNFSLCNGIPFKDNQHPVKTFSANAQLSFQYNITTPQPGHANLSVVDTKTNKPIGVPLKVFDKFGETTDNPDELDWSFMMSDTGKQCSTPGDCVLQFWWHSDDANKTYTSCVDFVQ